MLKPLLKAIAETCKFEYALDVEELSDGSLRIREKEASE